MKKRILHILNWEKYQARTDKDLPWCKLWGSLFDRPWFQKMPDSGKIFAIVLLDLARKTGNRIGEEYVFIEYLRGNYGILSTQNDVFMYCKSLSDNEFLSDNTSDLQDKIRQDKTRQSDKPNLVQLKKFETFYSKYPKKQAKTTALKAFLKLNPNDELFEKIISALTFWSTTEAWQKDNGKFVPMPSTWLNQERWTDERPVVAANQWVKP